MSMKVTIVYDIVNMTIRGVYDSCKCYEYDG